MRKRVYIAHPVGQNEERVQNIANAKKWCVWAARKGVAPCANWITLSESLEEDPTTETPQNRALAMECNLAEVEVVEELWLVGGRITPGMLEEADHARRCLIPVIDLTHLGALPPALEAT